MPIQARMERFGEYRQAILFHRRHVQQLATPGQHAVRACGAGPACGRPLMQVVISLRTLAPARYLL